MPIVFATCQKPGSRGGFQCNSCGKVLREPEYSEVENHDEYLVTVKGYGSTCTEQGKTDGRYCSLCGEVWNPQELLPLAEHKPVDDPAVSATCTTPGKTAGSHCSVCGTTLTPQTEKPATGHKKVVTVQAKTATCTEDGCTEGWKCETCGYEEASKVLPATGHKMVVTVQAKTPTCTEDGCTEGWKCETCGYEVASQVVTSDGHAPMNRKGKAPTCTEDGWTEGWLCENGCGYKEGLEVLPATGHTVQIDEAVADTCTTAGKTQGSHCAVCGQILEAQREIKPMGHAFEKRSGTAPTCVAAGKTDYYRCVDCGELLNAQQLPATGIHQFVPVSDNPSDGFTCQVCGKSDTGLTQSGSFPLLPYEQETEENVNGFRLSQGEAPVKSAQLQIYRNEKGDYVNVLCLTLEDGTVHYVSFETGSANLGELLTIYLQNAKPAATRAKLEAASQPNFGVGFDESGNPYLYVVQDGTKYAFMVSEPVIETVEIVFGTKDLTTTEETQPIQKFEEMKEEQNTPDIVKDTSDNTFDNTFYIHKFVDPDAEKEKVPEVIIPEAKMKANFEPLGDADHPGEDPNGHSETKHKEALTYVNDNCHKCGWCGALVTHKGVQNGVFTCCGGKCSHSEWDASLEKCICYHCGKTKEHNFVEKELGCECADCGVYYTKHDCTNTTCSRCGHTHSWNKEAGVLICSSCGLQEAHGWENNNGSCRCVICGKTQSHDYKDGICARCGYQCSHSWRDRNGVNICYDCQMTEVHDWQERDGGCWCTNCGKTQSHDYKDGFCTRCKARCAHPGGLTNGTCAVCGYTCSHDHGWARKNGDVCVCKICRMEEAHHWRRFGGFYICSNCGAFSTKKKPLT